MPSDVIDLVTVDPDDAFFAGTADDFPVFEVPHEKLICPPGTLPYYATNEAGGRLRRFAQRTPEFNWVDDPRLADWRQALVVLNQTDPTDPLEGATIDLWQFLYAVVRADRYCDGVVAVNAVALTRIANEIRRRLIADRQTQRTRHARHR